ncbi:MurR/RpiR family transcriptional regulator [Marinilactibacillus psychrotolerans]|uniref:MurR/RpiR family transcriptional regulator n=1 Tax=Marinilactibacillus psychrotolerans TaxID=191770 RepID=A0A5R9C5Y4_9LACT|nr:MurR/RpiR family transcriptional regulator [Marinilactibacillus psychrotolerans]TLQ08418.1 MurR/RpiR family transcriptional regulator [Marinilactibacillus psychrotolerans]
MLIEQLRNEEHFTNHEKDVAHFILDNIDEVSNMTSEQLAKSAYTSKATVVRLCQKLGLHGYQEFRLKLVAEINQNNLINRLLANEPITNASSYMDIMQTLPLLYDKAITNTRLSLDKNCMNRINNSLKNLDCINIYGTGISYMLAQSAAFKFSTLGIDCSAYERINAHALSAKKEKKTISFLISFTGANRTVTRIAEYLKQSTNNYIVGIVGPHHKDIQQWCDELIEIPNRDSLLSLDIITSFTATNYILDIFFSIILANNYDAHVKSSIEMLQYESLLLNKNYDSVLNEKE